MCPTVIESMCVARARVIQRETEWRRESGSFPLTEVGHRRDFIRLWNHWFPSSLYEGGVGCRFVPSSAPSVDMNESQIRLTPATAVKKRKTCCKRQTTHNVAEADCDWYAY